MTILPQVKSLTPQEGTIRIPLILTVQTDKRSTKAFAELKRILPSFKTTDKAILRFEVDPLIKAEAYRLSITPQTITIVHSDEAGAFYGVKTLKQLMAKGTEVACVTIEDEPDLKVRGYLLDISRNKIPTLKTLYGWIDLLSDLKYNHFELYVEGFSFLYPSFSELYTKEDTPITIEDHKKLEKYCADRCIDFVPNHNGLGHMSAWLAKPEFKELAAIEEGMFMWGAQREASTLNPLDPRSLELVKSYTTDVLKIAKSPYFHLCLDEPYELGEGKTAEAAKTIGIGRMYLDYMLKLVDHVHAYGKIPLVWGDVLNHYPELLPELPKDLIFVDWGYDSDAPFHQTIKRLHDYKVTFMAAPGTSSWNSITGRTYDAIENIRNACLYTKQYDGLGILLTDWGDNGHWQPLSVSLLPTIYTAAVAWSEGSGAYRHSIDYLNTVVFEDDQKMMGEVLADLGRYYRYQTTYHHNSTQIFDAVYSAGSGPKAYLEALKDHPFADPIRSGLMIAEFDLIKRRLKAAHPQNACGLAMTKELEDTLELLKVLIRSFAIASEELDDVKRRQLIASLNKAWPIRLRRFSINWLKNNRSGGLNQSLSGMENIAKIMADLAK